MHLEKTFHSNLCNIELRGLQEVLPKIQNLGANLIAISPENPDHSIIAIEKNKLTFPVLTDHGNRVARQFGVVFRISKEVEEFSKNVFKNDLAVRNGEDSYEVPIPATFVLDQTGKVRFVHADANYMTGRVEPETVLDVLNSIHKSTAK
jgi:peroxiredoxin